MIINKEVKHVFKVGEVYGISGSYEKWLVVCGTCGVDFGNDSPLAMLKLSTSRVDSSSWEHWKELYDEGLLVLVGKVAK